LLFTGKHLEDLVAFASFGGNNRVKDSNSEYLHVLASFQDWVGANFKKKGKANATLPCSLHNCSSYERGLAKRIVRIKCLKAKYSVKLGLEEKVAQLAVHYL
jgi:hypothetical protein